MKSDKMMLIIRKCNPLRRDPTDPECAEPEAIDQWIRDKGIMAETWVVH